MSSKTIPMQPPDTTRFYLPTPAATLCFHSIVNWQVSGEEKISGKLARKIGRIRRAIGKVLEESEAERRDLANSYRERYPEGHEKAGEFVPIFQKDEAGNDTDVVDPTQMKLRQEDLQKFNTEMSALLNEPLIIDCPCLMAADLDGIRSMAANFVQALFMLEENGPGTEAPKVPEVSGQPTPEVAADKMDAEGGDIVGSIKPAAEEDPQPEVAAEPEEDKIDEAASIQLQEEDSAALKAAE